jgi:nucleoid-associated protein YgaU
MPKVRHTIRKTFKNSEGLYEEMLNARGVNHIRQHETAEMTHPSAKQDRLLTKVEHTWQYGDKLWKLSQNHYGDPSFWWVIAWYNLKPTESHIAIGDRLLIPKPLNKILKYYGY